MKIEFDSNLGYLEISGRSFQDKNHDIYKPLIDALDVYSVNALPMTCVYIHFKYFSAATYKCMLTILRKLAMIKQTGKSVIVNWNYEDDFVLEVGEEYQELIDLPFEMKKVTSSIN